MHNLRSTSALALVLTLALAAPALADTTPGWYLDAGVGGDFTPDLITQGRTGADRTATFDPGYSALGGGGYAWDNGWRAEGEAYYSRAGIAKLQGAGGNHGSLSNTDFFVNGLYDINLSKLGITDSYVGKMWTPYVGVGVGAGLPETGHVGVLAGGGSFNDEDLQFAYQAIAGVAAQLDANWALTADYRYVATTDPTFKTTLGGTGSMQNASHNVILGLRYSFGEPPAEYAHASYPTPHYAPPMAKAAPAPVGQSYMVFFDFNKSILTPEANNILAKVASDYKAGRYTQVAVTGHTDTVGAAAYNQKLSVRRADAVKAELGKLGVPAKAIVAKGVGEEGLMVPTADGVREAQNRRAEIVFGSK